MAAAPRRDALPPPLKGAETTKVVTTCLVASRLSALRLSARPPSLAVGEPGRAARAPEGRDMTACYSKSSATVQEKPGSTLGNSKVIVFV